MERDINVLSLPMWPSTGDLAQNPGMCPDWESNWRPFGSQPALNPLSYTSQGKAFNLMERYLQNKWFEI